METGQIIGFALAITVPTLVTLIGIFVNNSRLTDLRTDVYRAIDTLRKDMDNRFDLLEKLFTERLRRVEEVMDARLKHMEEKDH